MLKSTLLIFSCLVVTSFLFAGEKQETKQEKKVSRHQWFLDQKKINDAREDEEEDEDSFVDIVEEKIYILCESLLEKAQNPENKSMNMNAICFLWWVVGVFDAYSYASYISQGAVESD